MFESTANFDLDDILLDTSFTQIGNNGISTQQCQAQKSSNSEVEMKISDTNHKHLENDNIPTKSTSVKDRSTYLSNNNVTEYLPNYRENFSETFTSPNRVLKRKFPGPAGLLPEIRTGNKSISELLAEDKFEDDDPKDMPILSQQTSSVFENGPWEEMSKDIYNCDGENLMERFNIKWIKRHASKQLMTHKAPFLAALIHNLDIIDGKNPTINVILKDATGDIRGTILHSFYKENAPLFRIGSVLVLKHFSVFSAGYNNHCLTITPYNLIAIYCPQASKELPDGSIDKFYGESSKCAVKKIVMQECNVEEILRKYNEDTMAYSQERKNNLQRNCSTAIASTSNCKSYFPARKSALLYINKPPSVVNTSVNVSRSMPNNSIIATRAERHISPTKKKFNFKQCNQTENKLNVTNRDINSESYNYCDKIVVSSSQISVKPDQKEHTDIWKNLLEGVDTDSLFGDF